MPCLGSASRGQIVSKERRISALDERLKMWEQYKKHKPIRQKLGKLKASGESITPKAWRAEVQKPAAEKDAAYLKMRAMREDIKAVETLRKTAERLAREEQTQRREGQER